MVHDQQIRYRLRQYLVSGESVTCHATKYYLGPPGIQDAAEAEEGIEKRPLAQRRSSLNIRAGVQFFLLL
jgi:hypothetical protein